jgi:hypothetical protein
MPQPTTTPSRAAQAAGPAAELPGRTAALPLWETFSVEDRQHLVRLLIQAARRQVQGRPAARERG